MFGRYTPLVEPVVFLGGDGGGLMSRLGLFGTLELVLVGWRGWASSPSLLAVEALEEEPSHSLAGLALFSGLPSTGPLTAAPPTLRLSSFTAWPVPPFVLSWQKSKQLIN